MFGPSNSTGCSFCHFLEGDASFRIAVPRFLHEGLVRCLHVASGWHKKGLAEAMDLAMLQSCCQVSESLDKFMKEQVEFLE